MGLGRTSTSRFELRMSRTRRKRLDLSKRRAIDDPSVGLLDAEECRDETITLDGSNRGADLEPGAIRKLAAAVGVFAVAIASTYVVPALYWAQPWSHDEDYVPFWNLVGREFMGQGGAAEQAQQQTHKFAELARQLEAQSSASPPSGADSRHPGRHRPSATTSERAGTPAASSPDEPASTDAARAGEVSSTGLTSSDDLASHATRPPDPAASAVASDGLATREPRDTGSPGDDLMSYAGATGEPASGDRSGERPSADEPRPDPASAIDVYPPYQAHPDDALEVEQALENPEAIASFYRALSHTELGIADHVTRVSHWGDSVLGNDGITAAIRHHLQARFGDAGHGFHALTQYDPSYRHKGIRFQERSPWSKCYIIRRCKSDGRYGYGGATVWSAGGAESVFRTANEGFGQAVSKFTLWYLAWPRGGRLQLRVDDEAPLIIETRAEQLEDRWHSLEIADGPHRVSVRAAGGGSARAYGVTLERAGPGVVWDGMALIGGFTNRFAELDPEHIQAQISYRDPDLLVFMFGGNDMLRERTFRDSMTVYEQEFAEVLRLAQGAEGRRACLIMSVIDHGERQGGRIVTRSIVPRMVDAQRRIAAAHGCAFFDTYQAMGGEGSMGRWSRMKPRLGSGDLAHPTSHGHKVLGNLLYRALMAGYVDHRRAVVGRSVRTEP
ncbi:MAG: hypothetical protein B7733_07535, partial [Myxococcales bacterium FL481]